MATGYRPTVAVSLVYGSTAASWVAYALLAVALPFRFESLGLSVVQYGVAIASLAFGMLLTEGVWGLFAFRLGNSRAILGLGAVVAVVYCAIGLLRTYPELAFLLGLLGALFVFQVPLMRWIALTALGPGTGGRGTGIYGLFSGIGLVAGTALGPAIFVRFGFGLLTVAVVAAYAVSVALALLLPWHEVVLPSRREGALRQMRGILTQPFGYASALVVFAYLAKPLVWNFLQYYSISLFHGTPSGAGYVIGAAQATSLVAGALVGFLVDRRGPGRSAPIGFALLMLGALAPLASSSYPEMIGATLLFATGVGWLSAALLPLALEAVPAPLQGTAVGVFGSFEDFGLLLGPIVISAAYSALGARSIFPVVGAIGLAGALLSVGVSRTAPGPGEGRKRS